MTEKELDELEGLEDEVQARRAERAKDLQQKKKLTSEEKKELA